MNVQEAENLVSSVLHDLKLCGVPNWEIVDGVVSVTTRTNGSAYIDMRPDALLRWWQSFGEHIEPTPQVKVRASGSRSFSVDIRTVDSEGHPVCLSCWASVDCLVLPMTGDVVMYREFTDIARSQREAVGA